MPGGRLIRVSKVQNDRKSVAYIVGFREAAKAIELTAQGPRRQTIALRIVGMPAKNY